MQLLVLILYQNIYITSLSHFFNKIREELKLISFNRCINIGKSYTQYQLKMLLLPIRKVQKFVIPRQNCSNYSNFKEIYLQ